MRRRGQFDDLGRVVRTLLFRSSRVGDSRAVIDAKIAGHSVLEDALPIRLEPADANPEGHNSTTALSLLAAV